jgi:hypothetical protein
MSVLADGEVLYPDVEIVALAREIEQSGVPLRRIDPKLVTYGAIASSYRRRANTFRDIDDIVIGHVWREKPKVRGPVKQSTRVAHCLGAFAPPRDLPSTIVESLSRQGISPRGSRPFATCRTAVRLSAGEAKGWGHLITGSR